jgi:hypothetical protein
MSWTFIEPESRSSDDDDGEDREESDGNGVMYLQQREEAYEISDSAQVLLEELKGCTRLRRARAFVP